MNPDSPIPTQRLSRGTAIAQARDWRTERVTLASPAVDVMTDLTRVKAATVSPSTSLRQAEQIMIYQGVRMLFVVSDMPAIDGLVTATTCAAICRCGWSSSATIRYDDLCVRDVMAGLSMLDAIDFDEMKSATVGNVVATLRRHGRDHLLVAEGSAEHGSPRVRGVISRTQIERQLGAPIPVTEVANTFPDVVKMLS